MIVYLYLAGMPLFTFLAWAFSDAFHAGEAVRDRVRVPLIIAAGVLWPVLLIGIAQLHVLCVRAKLLHPPSHHGLIGFTANCSTRYGARSRGAVFH